MKKLMSCVAISSMLAVNYATPITVLAQEEPTEPAVTEPAGPTVPVVAPPEQLLAARPTLNQTLTLEEAVAIALRESPVIRGAVAEVEAAAAQLDIASAERRPSVGLSGFLSGGSSPTNVVPPMLTPPQMVVRMPDGVFAGGKVAAMYPLYTGDRLQALVRSAAALRDVAQAGVETRRQETAFLTRLAYHETLARRALVDVWRNRLSENEEQLRIDRVRAEEGKIPPFYVQRSEAEVADSRQALTDAERDVALALTQLKTVMGVHPLSTIALAEMLEYSPSADLMTSLTSALDSDTVPDIVPATPPLQAGPLAVSTPEDLPALLRLAQNRRPELQAATGRTLAAQARATAERGAYKPQVNLFAMGEFGRQENTGSGGGVTFGLAASLPLFDGGLRRARVDSAEAQRRSAEEAREQTALEISQEVTDALLNLRAAEQNVATSQEALEAAREDYRVARIRYEAGKSIPVEVLDALAARVRAESNTVQALYNYNAARDQLLRAVGVLSVEVLSVEEEELATPVKSPAPVEIPAVTDDD